MTHCIVFLGSPEFAIPSLDALNADPRFDVALVVTQPDRPVGRGRKLMPPPVAAWASEAGLVIFQPESLRDADANDRIRQVRPDLLVVVAYGEILNKSMLQLAAAEAINVHPSLLPAYRGSSPIPAAILNGDDVTGVSIIKLVRRLDAGPILAQQEVPVSSDDTGESLRATLAEIAASMLPDVADAWINGLIPAVDQDDELASYTHEWSKQDARVSWSKPAREIERLVRAALPWPVAWSMLGETRVQLCAARLVNEGVQDDLEPGYLVDLNGVPCVATGDGLLELITVQPAGKRAMPATDWVRNLPPGGRQFH